MTKIVKSPAAWRRLRDGALRGKSVGFVPTMGALHEGHLSLVRRSRAENDATAVSIFVNPTQFNDKKDLKKYPRTFAHDLKMLRAARADYLFFPDYRAMYPDGYRYKVTENDFSRVLCGAHRPGHFDGVLTVVMKLLNITQADRAYFGEKDYQQYLLIKNMAEAFFLWTKIIPCPIVREISGLALSSRNALIDPKLKPLAPALHRALRAAPSARAAAQALKRRGFSVDYVEERLGRRFGAAYLGKVRLIDNVKKKNSL